MNRRILETFVVGSLLVILLTVAVVRKPSVTKTYPDALVVCDFDIESHNVVLVAKNGNMFEYEFKDGDVAVGELYAVVFTDKGTEVVTDDEILQIKYAGYVDVESWLYD